MDDPPGATGALRAETLARSLRERFGVGLATYPLSAFTNAGGVDVGAFRAHLRVQLSAGAVAMFACCGAGEFFSLSEPEYSQLLTVAVEEAHGEIPVIGGVGYGWAQAVRFAQIADGAGVDGLLVHPHYLVDAPQSGLFAHVGELAARTNLPLIVYQRGNVRYEPSTIAEMARLPTVIGLKDGQGDFYQLQRARFLAPENFIFINGSATAEIQARTYASIGIVAYSSSVASFAPEIGARFFRAFQNGEADVMEDLLSSFYWPFSGLRERCPGYAVSLVKAAARLRGVPVGPVRAPLVDPSREDLAALEGIVKIGLERVGAAFSVG